MPTSTAKRLTVVGGDGAWLTTSTGQRLIDATAGLWHANIGHGREEVARAAYDQMVKLETYHVFGCFANEPALRLADRLAQMVPTAASKVMFTSGGSDAIDLACKLARRHWQLEGYPAKSIILSRQRAYHGLHAYGTSITGLQYNRDGYGAESLVPETARISADNIDMVRAEIESIGASRIAAIIAEPVQGTGGIWPPSAGYLESLQELSRENNIIFIVDEVITGFGRTGQMFASDRWNLSPDIIVMAKGITSGYAPLGAVAVSPRIADRYFDSPDAPLFRHGLTYSGHATACVVAETNLDIIEREGLVARAAQLEGILAEAVEPLRSHRLVRDVRAGAGFLAGIQLQPIVSGDAIAETVAASGVITRVIHDNTLQISPPFVVTSDEVQFIADSIASAIDAYDA